MNLLKTSALSAIATGIKIINGLIVSKVIAVCIGPAGMAILGQFSNFISISLNLGCGGINVGIVKLVAEHREDGLAKRKILSTGFAISLLCSAVVSIALVLFRKRLTSYLLKDQRYESIIVIFGFSLICFVLNNLLVSVLNGQKEIKKLFVINVSITLVSLLLTLIFVFAYSLYGALLSFAIGQSVVFIIALIFIVKDRGFNYRDYLHGVDRSTLIILLKFSMMGLVSAVGTPFCLVLVRNYIGHTLSWEEAGFWQGMLRISDYYLLIVITAINMYYLPRFCEIKDPNDLRKEFWHGYRMILPLVALMCLAIYFVRNYIILALFTKSFMPMGSLFAVQLVGDLFKIAGAFLYFLLIARSMTKVFIISEIAYNALLVLLSIIFIQRFSLVGATYGFAATNILYVMIMTFYFRKLLLTVKSR